MAAEPNQIRRSEVADERFSQTRLVVPVTARPNGSDIRLDRQLHSWNRVLLNPQTAAHGIVCSYAGVVRLGAVDFGCCPALARER